MERPLIPVIPRNGMYVTAYAGNGRRFAGLVSRTWSQIPLAVRRRLLRFWRTCGVNLVSPEILLVSSWSHQDGRQYGICGHGGHTLKFWAEVMDLMPDDLVMVVIAHEMTHSYLSALGIEYGRSPTDQDQHLDGALPRLLDREELDVADMLGRWDFDEETVDAWGALHEAEILSQWQNQIGHGREVALRGYGPADFLGQERPAPDCGRTSGSRGGQQ